MPSPSATAPGWRCRRAFAWEARIVLQAGGLCTFVVEGEAEAPVETNRCGLVLLHPPPVPGCRCG